MGNRDHLVPSMTVDRNGHAKTVYVAPSDRGSRSSSLNSAIPTLARFESYDGDDEEGTDDGYGPDWEGVSDPGYWEANEFNADDAQDWHYAGFDADTAYSWKKAGFDSSDAQEWRGSFSEPDDAKEWQDAGFNSDEAKEWNSNGHTSESAVEWQRNDFDHASEASEWSNNGFDPGEAREWIDAGFSSADTAQEWKEAARSGSVDKSDLLTLQKADKDAEDARSWLSLLDTVRKIEGGVSDLEGLLLVMDGVNPSAGHEYVDRFPFSQWSILASGEIEFDKVSAVQKAYSRIDENQQDEYGDDYEEDEVGNLEEAVAWIGPAQGFTSKKERAILALIATNNCRPSDVNLFLSNSSRLDYDTNTEHILKANKWAQDSALESSTLYEKAEAFEEFYVALKSIESMDELVEEHGAEKVEAAMRQGMLNEVQLRNFLENIQVAEISAGAL